MVTIYSAYILLVLLSACMAGLAMILLLKHRSNRTARSMLVLVVIILGSELSVLLGMLNPDYVSAVFWYGNVRSISNAFIASAGFYFIYTFLNGKNQNLLWVIWIVPFLTVPIALTNSYHHWVYPSFNMRLVEYYIRADWEAGIWYYVYSIHSYILSIGMFYLLVSWVRKSKKLPKWRGLLVLSISLIIAMSVTLDVFGLTTAPGLMNLPLGLGLVCLITILGVWYLDLFDVLPIARETLLKEMPDAIFVLNEDNIVIEANPASLFISGRTKEEMIGKEFTSSITIPSVQEQARDILARNYHDILTIPVNGLNHYFDVLVTGIYVEQQIQVAKLIVLRDITLLVQMQDQEKERIALVERQRIARDLHDAVSQTLFSARVTSEMVLRQKDSMAPQALWEDIAHITGLIKSALGEMRILMLELRPEGLAHAEISTLFSNLADAMGSRLDARIDLEIQGECQPPADVKMAFYRITQEALNNIAKHAHCEHIKISLECATGSVKLVIVDDGIGFSPKEKKYINLGLGIMFERASEVGASLDIWSEQGKGARVVCEWQDKNGKFQN